MTTSKEIAVELVKAWLTHTPGTVLSLGRAQADLLIQRGIAVTPKSEPRFARNKRRNR